MTLSRNLIAALLCGAMLLASCGGGQSRQPSPAPAVAEWSDEGDDAAMSQPAAAAPQLPVRESQPLASAQDPQDRIADAFDKTISFESSVLPSYHLEASGRVPGLDRADRQLEMTTFTFKADVAGNDMHLTDTRTIGAKAAETYEGYWLKGGLANGGTEYQVENGKLVDGYFVGLSWAILPLQVGIPLAVAATGASRQGDESIEGRAAEKYAVDSDKAPLGVAGLIGATIGITKSKGMVWVDKQSGALVKLVIDYEQNVLDDHQYGDDTSTAPTTVGSAAGHIELAVSRIGQVSVKSPR
jgi:hypothetical protein